MCTEVPCEFTGPFLTRFWLKQQKSHISETTPSAPPWMSLRAVVPTDMMQGLMQNQQALHHSQNAQLFSPSIISMSLISRFPPRRHDENTPQMESKPFCHLYIHVSIIITLYMLYIHHICSRNRWSPGAPGSAPPSWKQTGRWESPSIFLPDSNTHKHAD